ncbi:MAG TPA: ParB/RepB/Spo0J family partition protein [Acidobacteriaceae bacterium]|nr:ParB/RepB/Spo0J family partition protein [Acidobacteriaceae bacterium]
METTSPTPTDPKRRNALGKGIESLLGPRPQPPAATPNPTGKPLEIALDRIDRNPNQTRTAFDDLKLNELARSIATSGVVQPIVVRELPGGRYQLIMGERRWRASKAAGKATIPAIVRQVSDEQALEMTIVENLQRADLNPMEQARAYERLMREFKMTQDRVAERTGKDRVTVANFLRLLKLPNQIQQLVEAGKLSFGHARALLSLTADEIDPAARKVMEQAMSVRQTEKFVQEMMMPKALPKGRPAPPPQDPNVHEAQDRLQRKLGLKVRIEDKKGKGRVIIEYSGVDDFDAILSALGE